MDISVRSNQEISINETSWPDKITTLEVNGKLSITNNSDQIKLLELDDFLTIEVAGEMYITGKLVQIGTGNGKYGQKIPVPIKGYNVPALYIQNSDGEYEKWLCINSGQLNFNFSDFAPNTYTGKVFRIEDDNIVFSDKEGNAVIPASNSKIMVPNIFISTSKDADYAAYFDPDKGGVISLRNIVLDFVKSNFNGFSKVSLDTVFSTKSVSCSYVANLYLHELAVANDSLYSSGLVVAYCNENIIDNVTAQSKSNYGIVLEYMSSPIVSDITAITLKRDSNTDYAISLNTISDSKINKVNVIGGSLSSYNSSKLDIKKVVAIDSIDLKTNSSQGLPNIRIENSSDIKIDKVTIPNGGAGFTSLVFVLNSVDIDVSNVNSDNKTSTYAIATQVAMKCKFARFKVAGVKEPERAIFIDNRSKHNVFQNIEIGGIDSINVGGIDTSIKGVTAKSINFLTGSFNTMGAQLYTDKTKGALVTHFTNNNKAKIVEGSPKFSYNEGLTIRKDDVVEIGFQSTLNGIQFENEDPIIDGGSSDLRIFFKVMCGKFESDFLILNKDNITSVNSEIKNKTFTLIFRIDGSALKENTKIFLKRITIPTSDSRFEYPMSYKKLFFNFDKLISSDGTAVFALLYANTYNNGITEPVRDKDGHAIVKKVNGNSSYVFEYDYENDNLNGRVPNRPFQVVAVLNSKNITKPVEIRQMVTEDDIFNVTFNYNKDNAEDIYLDIAK